MKNYTQIPNEILEPNQLSPQAKLLHCALLRFCQSSDWCYPSQKMLAKCLDLSTRMVRTYTKELESYGLVYKIRTGFNRPNTYRVAKAITREGKNNSYHIGSTFPLHDGSVVPPNNTYRRRKYNNKIEDIKKDLGKKLSMDKI